MHLNIQIMIIKITLVSCLVYISLISWTNAASLETESSATGLTVGDLVAAATNGWEHKGWSQPKGYDAKGWEHDEWGKCFFLSYVSLKVQTDTRIKFIFSIP